MKYTEAWSSIVSQNLNLKLMTVILSVITLILGLICLRLTFKNTLIVERSCYSRGLEKSEDSHTPTEIEAFAKEALAQRFNSEVQPVDGLISTDELSLRVQEQKELKNRNMTQKVIFNSITQAGGDFRVDADRIISVGDVRSAFRFSLLLKLEAKSRSLSDPYGLLLVSTKLIEKDEKK